MQYNSVVGASYYSKRLANGIVLVFIMSIWMDLYCFLILFKNLKLNLLNSLNVEPIRFEKNKFQNRSTISFENIF